MRSLRRVSHFAEKVGGFWRCLGRFLDNNTDMKVRRASELLHLDTEDEH